MRISRINIFGILLPQAVHRELPVLVVCQVLVGFPELAASQGLRGHKVRKVYLV
jgi:hypothetical protein